MIHDSERCEVARRLRAHTMNSYINPLCAFEHMVIGKCDGDCTYDLEKECEENICKRLADLIETRMPTDDERPVLANGKRGMFRGWFQISYMNGRATIAHPVAVVELEDGSCETFQACMIKFLDVEVKSDDNR